MLGKLFKYEFKNTYKVMLTIYAVLLAATTYGAIIFSIPAPLYGYMDDSPLATLLYISFFILYVLAVFTLFVVTYVYMFFRFYKTMYSDQGYLTHTLPVEPTTVFHVKLAVSLIWTVITLLLFLFSIFVIIFSITDGEFAVAMIEGGFSVIADPEQFRSAMGMSFGCFLLYLVAVSVFSCLYTLLMAYASISIGQLFGQHKIVGSIAAGLVLYFIQQIAHAILSIFTFGSMFVFSTDYYSKSVTFADMLLTPPVIAGMVLSLAFGAAFYIICVVILKKHINLD